MQRVIDTPIEKMTFFLIVESARTASNGSSSGGRERLRARLGFCPHPASGPPPRAMRMWHRPGRCRPCPAASPGRQQTAPLLARRHPRHRAAEK